MQPLADPSDLADRLGVTFTSEQNDRAAALLADASAAVRNYTRQDITIVEDDVATLETTAEQWLFLPQRPVISVSSVVAGGATLATGFWKLENDALFRYYGWASRLYLAGTTQPWNQPDTIVVTYTHGYGVVPDDIVRVVCKLAKASWVNPDGLREWQLGDLRVVQALETVGEGALDAEDKKILDFYRRPRRSVKLSAGVL
jgi:hypothetical protein